MNRSFLIKKSLSTLDPSTEDKGFFPWEEKGFSIWRFPLCREQKKKTNSQMVLPNNGAHLHSMGICILDSLVGKTAFTNNRRLWENKHVIPQQQDKTFSVLNRLHAMKKTHLIIQISSLYVNIYEEIGNTEIAFFFLFSFRAVF